MMHRLSYLWKKQPRGPSQDVHHASAAESGPLRARELVQMSRCLPPQRIASGDRLECRLLSRAAGSRSAKPRLTLPIVPTMWARRSAGSHQATNPRGCGVLRVFQTRSRETGFEPATAGFTDRCSTNALFANLNRHRSTLFAEHDHVHQYTCLIPHAQTDRAAS